MNILFSWANQPIIHFTDEPQVKARSRKIIAALAL
jgi:hypothetical protein